MLAQAQTEELDAGPRQRGPGQERFCAVTRTVRPSDELIRFVAGPGGVVPDLKRKLPGRGLWIGADRATVVQAVVRKVFARGFKRDVDVPADLPDRTEDLLARSVLDALAIAGKSGRAVTGFSKVEAALARDNVVALLHASDAGADGVAKLASALRNRPDAERIAVVRTLNSGQLDLALGRSNVVHAALTGGTASDTFLTRLRRLERFRTGFSGASAGARA